MRDWLDRAGSGSLLILDEAHNAAPASGARYAIDSQFTNPIALMHALIRKDPRNAQRIFPFIGGEEVNDSPTHAHHRFVIDFRQMSEHEARAWPDFLSIVEEKVKPERDLVNRDSLWERWWRHADPRPGLYEAIRDLGRVRVCTLHQEHWMLTFLPPDVVFSHALGVIATENLSALCVLQCHVHEAWARFFGSSLEERFRYTPSDCFETFPFPERWESSEELEYRGRRYFDFRAALMVRNNEGLTKTYNRFHDPDERNPDIVKLRDLHAAMDRAVLDAYGWTDIQPTCEFILDYEDDADDTDGQPSRKKKPWRYRWPDKIRDEVLGRLLELNAQRAREEASAGAAKAGPTQSAKVRKSRGASTPLLDD